MEFNPNTPSVTATVEVCVINSEQFEDYAITKITCSIEEYNDLIREDIPEVIKDDFLDKLYQKTKASITQELKFTIYFDFQYRIDPNNWTGEVDIDYAYAHKILKQEPCIFDEEVNRARTQVISN